MLYTKKGRPLQVDGDYVYSRSGRVVGRILGEKVFGPKGRYVGTIVGDRLVYRSTDRGAVAGSFSIGRRAGFAVAKAASSGIWGDEPEIPD